jgi:hydrogenase expression/formation protein HypC
MQVIECDGYMARCTAQGIERSVNLFLLQHEAVAPGDHVLVHVGYAIQKIDGDAARSTWELLDRLYAAEDAPQHPPQDPPGPDDAVPDDAARNHA